MSRSSRGVRVAESPRAGAQRQQALGAVDGLRHVVPGAGLLPRLAEVPHAVFVLELDRVMVPDVAVAGAVPHFAAAHAAGAHGMRVQDPVGDVDLVRRLFDHVIAAQPEEHAPVANLVLQFAHPLRLAAAGPAAALARCSRCG